MYRLPMPVYTACGHRLLLTDHLIHVYIGVCHRDIRREEFPEAQTHFYSIRMSEISVIVPLAMSKTPAVR